MRIVTWVALGSLAIVLPACEDAQLKGAKAEVKKTEAKLDLPAVPAFDIPESSNPHNVREMRLIGRNLIDTDVDVKGYVVWIYRCHEAGGPKGPIPGDTDEEKLKHLEKHPELCWKPHFILGESADTPPNRGIWVVEVPREMRPDELKRWRRLPKEERDETPQPPEIKEGDEVIVTGTWMKRSPAGFANSIGLLLYKDLRHEGEPVEEEGDE
jgi:hypothetical protein